MDRWAGGVHLSIPFQLKMIARALSSYTSRRVALVLNGGFHGDPTLDAASWWPRCAANPIGSIGRRVRRCAADAARCAVRVSAARDGMRWGGVGWGGVGWGGVGWGGMGWDGVGWDGMGWRTLQVLRAIRAGRRRARRAHCVPLSRVPLSRCPTWPLSHLVLSCMQVVRDEKIVPIFAGATVARTGGCTDSCTVRYTSHAACCLLHVVCCMPHVVCCMLSVACCMLSVACCMLSVACCLLPAACCMLLAAMLQAALHAIVLHLACVICCACARWPRTACHMLHARRVQRWCGSDG